MKVPFKISAKTSQAKITIKKFEDRKSISNIMKQIVLTSAIALACLVASTCSAQYQTAPAYGNGYQQQRKMAPVPTSMMATMMNKQQDNSYGQPNTNDNTMNMMMQQQQQNSYESSRMAGAPEPASQQSQYGGEQQQQQQSYGMEAAGESADQVNSGYGAGATPAAGMQKRYNSSGANKKMQSGADSYGMMQSRQQQQSSSQYGNNGAAEQDNASAYGAAGAGNNAMMTQQREQSSYESSRMNEQQLQQQQQQQQQQYGSMGEQANAEAMAGEQSAYGNSMGARGMMGGMMQKSYGGSSGMSGATNNGYGKQQQQAGYKKQQAKYEEPQVSLLNYSYLD